LSWRHTLEKRALYNGIYRRNENIEFIHHHDGSISIGMVFFIAFDMFDQNLNIEKM